MPECQFRVSCCFLFQKYLHVKYRQNRGNLFLRTYNIGKLPEDRRPPGREAPGAHTPWGRSLGWGRAQLGCGGPGWPPAPILRLYIPLDAKTLIRKTIFHEKLRRGRHRQSQIGGVLTFFPAACRRGNHHRGLLHHHACLRSDV